MRRHQRRENSSIGSHKVTFPAPIATSQGAYRLSNSPVGGSATSLAFGEVVDPR